MPNDKKDCVMVAYSETGNSAVLIVGRKTKFINADIVNAFSGDEARELWKKTNREGEVNESNRFNYKFQSTR